MALTEDVGGNGGRSPAPRSKPTPKPSLSKWDDGPVLAQANPAPRPRPQAQAGSSYDPSRLKKLTPFELVVQDAPALSDRSQSYAPTQGYGGIGIDQADKQVSSTPSRAEAMRVLPEVTPGSAPTEKPDTEPEVKKRGGRAYKLTWEEYNKLSEDQRAAVDFNTMLLQAREKDLNASYETKPGGGRNAEYDAAVERMFGEDGGSETYAPETMAVLRSIDFKASGETLDDFLSLEAAVSAKDMKEFEIAPVEASVMYQDGTAKASGALVGEEQAAQRTSRLQQALAKGGELIQSFKASAAVNRSPLAVRYGGTANEAAPALGFGDDETSRYFRMAADALSRDLTPDELNQAWGALNQRLSPEELVAFKKYADDVTRDAVSFRPPEWTQAEGVYFNPQLIRERLGLDRRSS